MVLKIAWEILSFKLFRNSNTIFIFSFFSIYSFIQALVELVLRDTGIAVLALRKPEPMEGSAYCYHMINAQIGLLCCENMELEQQTPSRSWEIFFRRDDSTSVNRALAWKKKKGCILGRRSSICKGMQILCIWGTEGSSAEKSVGV